jgi:hypothetical protein
LRARAPEAETVATLPLPPSAPLSVTASAVLVRSVDAWPCARPPIITEHQQETLERMTKSGRPDLVQEAADIRAKICAGWAHRTP